MKTGRLPISSDTTQTGADTDQAVRHGTASLFADLGCADADAHLLKAAYYADSSSDGRSTI